MLEVGAAAAEYFPSSPQWALSELELRLEQARRSPTACAAHAAAAAHVGDYAFLGALIVASCIVGGSREIRSADPRSVRGCVGRCAPRGAGTP